MLAVQMKSSTSHHAHSANPFDAGACRRAPGPHERCVGHAFGREELVALARAELAALGSEAPLALREVLEGVLEEGWEATT